MTEPLDPENLPVQEPVENPLTQESGVAPGPAAMNWVKQHRLLTIAGSAVVAAAVVAGALVFAGSGSITVHGAEAVCSGGVSDYLNSGTSMLPSDAYPDITDGTQVVVTDSSGSVIGTGSLSSSGANYNAFAGGEDDYKFTVTVPAGETRYGISIGHNRGTVWFSERDMRKGPALGLGC